MENLQIQISEDGLSATLTLTRAEAGALTYPHLRYMATQSGIVFGLADETWFTTLLPQLDKPTNTLQVAHGRKPVPGRAPTLQYHFETDYLCAGQISADGRIDYKNRGTIPFTREGTLLAEMIPSVMETPGITVQGKEIKTPVPTGQMLSAGPGTSLSPDNLAIYAARDGSPHLALDGTVSVAPEILIEGDVGLRTGHIIFNGNILIKGVVHEGFRVQGMHITARALKGAIIQASSGVMITEGIIDSQVSVEGSLQAKYVSNSQIDAFGDVIIAHEIMDSNLRLSGRFVNKRGEIISSEIAALKGFFIKNVGTGVSRPCHLKIGVNDHVKNVLTNLTIRLKSAKEKLDKEQLLLTGLESRLITLQSKTASLVSMHEQLLRDEAGLKQPDRERKDENKHQLFATQKKLHAVDTQIHEHFTQDDALCDSIDRMKETIVPLEKAWAELQKQYHAVASWTTKQGKRPEVHSSGLLMEGTILTGPNSRRVLSRDISHAKLKEHVLEDGTHKIM
ncbi:DUF342 domain-containing protein [Desulfoluna sp.]|uniref:DUF342 domain-containing protein n=1 Tax=Desulfoluna sp. TaxID=2045199 RepID=UPI002634422E|nr:FapA family protein [Desulfoluna sp.]